MVLMNQVVFFVVKPEPHINTRSAQEREEILQEAKARWWGCAGRGWGRVCAQEKEQDCCGEAGSKASGKTGGKAKD